MTQNEMEIQHALGTFSYKVVSIDDIKKITNPRLLFLIYEGCYPNFGVRLYDSYRLDMIEAIYRNRFTSLTTWLQIRKDFPEVTFRREDINEYQRN